MEKKNLSQGSENSLPERQLQNGGEGGESSACGEHEVSGHFWSLTCAPGPSGAVEYTEKEGLTEEVSAGEGRDQSVLFLLSSPGAYWDCLGEGEELPVRAVSSHE